MITSGLHIGTRIPAFAMAAVATLAIASLNMASGEGDNAAPYQENAKKNLPLLRQEMLNTLNQSRKCDPEEFKRVAGNVGSKAFGNLSHSLTPVDMSRVRNTGYAVFNSDIWRYRTVSCDLQGLALAYNIPESPLAGKPEAASKAAEAFEWLLSIASPNGSCEAPDSNIDRFAYVQFWDAFILMAPALSEDLQNRFLKHLLAAADYQYATFGKRTYPWGGGYPNMDAAYMLVMEQAFRLFRKPEYDADIDRRIGLLQKRIQESTWEYLAGWNPQANYTQVTLGFVGRLYQLSGKPAVLEQIKQHTKYYTYHLEPNGLIEYAMTPFIKHDWVQTPYGACVSPLELVNHYAPTPVLRGEVAKMRETIPVRNDPLILFWISSVSAEKAPQPTDFVRETSDFSGFQARVTKDGNTLSVYGTGKKIAVDTRVAAMVSSKSETGNAGLAGVFLELFQNGTSYYLGEMNPNVDLKTTDKSASLSIVQNRRAMGPQSRPLIMGNHHADMKNWKYDCWKGGSPDGPPVETKEQWAWDGERLKGEITVTAQTQTALDGIKITIPVLLSMLTESRPISNGQAYRFGKLCFSVQSTDPRWKYPNVADIFDFRIDAPPGKYSVTIASGAANAPTDPFDVYANGKKTADSVRAEKGAFVERTFATESINGSILFRFDPHKGGNHWKISSISIASADGKSYSKKFAVEPMDQPATPGIQRISGADIYNRERGYGWSRDLSNGERHYPEVSGSPAHFITAPSSNRQIVMQYEKANPWEKGDTAQMSISIGVGESLDSWLTVEKPHKN